MRRIAILFSLLLACVSFSAADTFTLTRGFGEMSGTINSFNPPPSYIFALFGSGSRFRNGKPQRFPVYGGASELRTV